MKRIVFILLCLFTYIASAQIVEPVNWQFSISQFDKNGNASITAKSKIDAPWHMYDLNMPEDGPISTSFEFSKLQNIELVGKVTSKTKPIEKSEAAFMGMLLRYYEGGATFIQKVKVKDLTKPYSINGQVRFMCCNDQQCLPPTTKSFVFSAKALATADENKSECQGESSTVPVEQVNKKSVLDSNSNGISDTVNSIRFDFSSSAKDSTVNGWESSVEELQKYGADGNTSNGSLWSIFLAGLLGGLIAVVTPCVWPIIPMTVSFFIKRNEDKSKGRRQAILYGCAIVIIYVVLGLLMTLIFGASALNELSTNAVFNIFLFLLLIVFACSFFGGFEIILPASWSTAIDTKAESTSGILGILLMACTLVIVSFSCTGPIIGTILVSVASEGNLLGPVIGMFGFALALAIPFTFFAFFPTVLKSLPRSGNWLNTVKVLLGFFELAFSLKFLSVADQAYGWHILSRTTFLSIWIVLFLLAGVYLLGKLRLPNDGEQSFVSVPRLFMSIGSFAFAVYLIPGLFGSPLNIVSAFAPPLTADEPSIYTKQVHAKFNDYDEALKYAIQEGKPLVIDFTGYGCVNCRKMEAAVWSDPNVSSLLTDKYVLVSLYVDDRTALPEPYEVKNNGEKFTFNTVGEKWSYLEQTKFGSNGQPFYVLMSPDGHVLNSSFAFTENADEFTTFLQKGLSNFKK